MTTKASWPYAGTVKYPEHARGYLAARGVLDAAKAAGIVYVTAEEAARALSIREPENASDGLAIPFAKSDTGAVRFLAAGISPKFKQKAKTRNTFYEGQFPPGSGRTWKDVRQDPRVTLHIVEGPLKALACTWNDIPALGINGVWGWSTNHEPFADFGRYEWRDRLVVLCFDSDLVWKAQVRQALKRLGDHLTTLGAKVRIKLLPSADGVNVGADDYLVAHGAKEFRALEKLPLADPQFVDWGAAPVVQELNKILGFLMHQGRATILSVREDPDYPDTTKVALSRVHDVELEYANQFVEYKNEKGDVVRNNKFKTWFADPFRRAVRQLTFAPGAAPGYDFATKDYNLWQRWGVVPHEPDADHSWQRLKAHVHDVVASGNEAHSNYILNWLAFCMQHPDRRPEVALVLLGGEGTGKGILLNSVIKLFGRHALHLVNQRQLTGNFNDHLKDALFIFADEAFFAGDKQSIGALKGMITEPTTVIEPKFVNAYTLPNYKKIAIASNENWAVPADADARRFAVFRVSDKRKGKFSYFKAIADELSSGGHEAMLYDLQHRDISTFDPRHFPSTEALFQQKKLNFDEITAWWFEKLRAGRLDQVDEAWIGKADRDIVHDEISKRMANAHDKRSLETKIGIQLRKLCPKVQDKRLRNTRADGVTVRKRKYLFPSLSECRRSFEAAMRTTIDWKTGEADTGDAP
jgi:hypothetical protein